MNAKQALTELRKILGANACIQDHKAPTSPEQREQASAGLRAAVQRRNELGNAMAARRAAVLAADVEFQAIKADYDAARKAVDAAPRPGYRYVGGIDSSFAFHVRAEGDTLADLVEQARARASGD